jgi:hypothetical protein
MEESAQWVSIARSIKLGTPRNDTLRAFRKKLGPLLFPILKPAALFVGCWQKAFGSFQLFAQED